MPNGFITITVNAIESGEADLLVNDISSYRQDPITGSVVTMISGTWFRVKETVPQIRALIAAEKGT